MMHKKLETPIGVLEIIADGKGVTGLYVCHAAVPEDGDTLRAEQNIMDDREQEASEEDRKAEGYVLQAARELTEYFAGMRTVFDVPLHEQGTPFQKRVWAALRTIPYGETRSYGQIAAQIGNPKGARAVGMADNRNPIMIFTPCHRVIGADGSLVGFGGGLPMKKYLLELEKRGQSCPPDRV